MGKSRNGSECDPKLELLFDMLSKLISKKILFALLLLILMTAPYVHAVVLESGIPNTDLTPGKDIQGLSIAQYINYIYLFVLGVVGIAVFASLVFWGVVWISSGIADRRGEALGKIKDAFTGLAIALGAYIILNTINPDLLTLKDLSENKVETTPQSSVIGPVYEWHCLLEVTNLRRVDDLKCAGVDKKSCGLMGTAGCFEKITANFVTSSPMAPTCQPGTQGANVNYQWTEIPSIPNKSKNCADSSLGIGWTLVSNTFCTTPSPGISYDCCGKCNQ